MNFYFALAKPSEKNRTKCTIGLSSGAAAGEIEP